MAEIEGYSIGELPTQTTQDALNALSWLLTAQMGLSNTRISLHELLEYANAMGKDVLTFNIGANVTPAEGQLAWNPEDKTLNLGLAGGSILQLGEEEVLPAVNQTGAAIHNGQPVVVTGSQGNRVVISLAQAVSTDTPYKLVAIATQEVANNALGYFTRSGLVRDVNTSAWAAGTVLYVSATAGQLTSNPPAKPLGQIPIGVVSRQHAQNGSILVAPIVLPRLAHLPDVKITSPTNGQSLVYDAALQLWVNATVGGGSGQEYPVYNNTGADIPPGRVVHISGGYELGGVVYPTVGQALATAKSTASFIAMSKTLIRVGEVGTVICQGNFDGVDTSDFAANSIVYLSPTVQGGLTMVEPAYPYFSCRVAIVTKVGVSGSLLVCPDTDPNYAVGTTLISGLQAFPIVLASQGVTIGSDASHAGYYSSLVIPAANLEANYMGFFVTQAATCLGMRMGVFSPGSGSDTLLAQTPFWSGGLSLGINVLALTQDAAGNPLGSSFKFQANTKYMLAIQISANGAILLGHKGMTTNPPNHLSRIDGWNPPIPTDGMVTSAGYTQSDTRLWLATS